MTVRISRISQPYWNAIPEDERERITAAVPAGCYLFLSPGHRAKPGTTTVSLRREPGEVIREARATNLAWACWTALAGETVTTDAAGWVKGIA